MFHKALEAFPLVGNTTRNPEYVFRGWGAVESDINFLQDFFRPTAECSGSGCNSNHANLWE